MKEKGWRSDMSFACFESEAVVHAPGRWLDEFLNSSIFGFSTLPEVEVRESKDEYRMEVDLPGIRDDEIDIELDDNLLTIFSCGGMKEFRRSFLLPKDVDRGGISHEFRNGMLVIRFPRVSQD
jgi:HSP20 family protein